MTMRDLTSGNGGTRAMQPVSLFGSLHREIDRLFDDFTRGGLGLMAMLRVLTGRRRRGREVMICC